MMKLIRANKIMMTRYSSSLNASDVTLPRHLLSILESGLIEKDGCVFLCALLANCATIKQSYFPDMTGYECFVNHEHIDGVKLRKAIEIGVTFLARISIICRSFGVHGDIRGILSVDDKDVTVRFHLLRHEEAWLSDDIDGYEEDGVAEFEL